jgi:hypothetical protein
MSNHQTGRVKVEALGTVYTLQFSINALCALEAELGTNEAMDIQALIGERPSVTVLRTLFWAALLEHQPGTRKEDAGAIMDALGLMQSAEIMTRALVMAMGNVGAPGTAAPGAPAPLAVAAAAPVAATG